MNGHESEYVDCAEVDGPATYDAVAPWLRDRGVFWSWIHVAETSCLGLCNADGAAITVHP